MRTPDVFASSAFRAAIGITLSTAFATLLIFGFVYLRITSADEANVRHIIAEEASKGAGYTDEQIRAAIDLRLTRDLRRLDYVALFDASGKVLIGNIDALPAIPVDGAAHFVAEARPPGAPDLAEPAIFVARQRPNGDVLLLGRSLLEVYGLRQTVLGALASAMLPALGLALAIGAYFARRGARRLDRIHETIVRITRGDLQARLPEAASGDEIGRVARDVNVMLDEIARLVLQIKSVGDNIAHDLRGAIAGVRGRLERGVADPEENAPRLAASQALAELDKAMTAIDALLRLAEIEHAPRTRAFKPIELTDICADLFDFYEPLGREKSIAMTLETAPPALAMGDADLIREALANLIDNALKFTDPGGAVRVYAGTEDGRPTVRIHDTGMGVAPADRIKIFDRFYRTGSSERVPGSGLGLSIAAAVANLHDFDLRVEDNRPGSVFRLSPRDPPPSLSRGPMTVVASNSKSVENPSPALVGEDGAKRRMRVFARFLIRQALTPAPLPQERERGLPHF
jgi:signal transduction histidine kinase